MSTSTIELDIPLRLGRGFKTDAERAALEVRAALKLSPHDRLPARKLANLLKINVITPDRLTGMPPQMLQELTVDGRNRWSAALVKGPPTHKHLLIHNPTHSLLRQESDIFHEISHHICKHEPDGIFHVGGLVIREYSKEKENQAEFLGYALHLSRDALFWANRRGMSFEDISEHFCASRQLIQHRMNVTGVAKILARAALS